MADPAPKDEPNGKTTQDKAHAVTVCERICPACGAENPQHIRGKLHCRRCHAILATCCD